MRLSNKIVVFKELVLNRIGYLLPNYPQHRFIYKLFEYVRQYIWKSLFKKFGDKSYIRSKTQILGYKKISIGNNCIIGPDSVLNGSDDIVIGNFFLSGPSLIIYTAEHGLCNGSTPFIKQTGTQKKVIIGNNVYVGARVTILMGINIGDNVIIAAGSVVTKNIPSNELWGGVPAKRLKSI